MVDRMGYDYVGIW